LASKTDLSTIILLTKTASTKTASTKMPSTSRPLDAELTTESETCKPI
jgi:hypothetical protein